MIEIVPEGIRPEFAKIEDVQLVVTTFGGKTPTTLGIRVTFSREDPEDEPIVRDYELFQPNLFMDARFLHPIPDSVEDYRYREVTILWNGDKILRIKGS